MNPKEFKVISLRECPLPDQMTLADDPAKAAAYWNLNVVRADYFNPEVETLVVLLLNTRYRIKGHSLVSMGLADACMCHPREIFRTAICMSASCIIVMHNHPSGDPTPSEADIKITRDLHRAGQLLKIDLKDHIIIGKPMETNTKGYCSLRELGYLYT